MKLIPVNTSIEHYRTCKAWLEDKEITKWLTSTLRFGRYLKMTHEMLISNKRNKLFFIDIQNKLVGLVGLMNIDPVDTRAEVWYLTGSRADRGKNIATQAVSLLKNFAVQDLEIVTLYVHVAESNAASLRVLEKNDFEYVGKFRKAFLIDDSYEDLVIFDWVVD